MIKFKTAMIFIYFGIFMNLSLYHLFIYLAKQVDKRNLAYFFYGVSVSIMLFVFNVLDEIFIFDYNIPAFPVAMLVAATCSYFLETVFDLDDIKKYIRLTKVFYFISGLVLFFTYIFTFKYICRVVFNITSILYLFVYLSLMIKEILKHKQYKDSIKLCVLIGFIPVSLSIIYICILHIPAINNKPNLSLFLPQYSGYLGMMITFAYALGIQYRRDHDSVIKLNKKLTDMNASLENEVVKRTKEIELEKIKRASVEYELAEREKQVLKLLFNGMTSNEIALLLYISESTVKTYVKRIYQKTETKSRIELFKKIKLL